MINHRLNKKYSKIVCSYSKRDYICIVNDNGIVIEYDKRQS